MAASGRLPAAPGAQPYLGARSVLPGSGDMMRDGVPRLGVRPLILWRLARAGGPGSSRVAGAGRGSSVRGRGGRVRELAAHAAGASASSPSSRSVW